MIRQINHAIGFETDLDSAPPTFSGPLGAPKYRITRNFLFGPYNRALIKVTTGQIVTREDLIHPDEWMVARDLGLEPEGWLSWALENGFAEPA